MRFWILTLAAACLCACASAPPTAVAPSENGEAPGEGAAVSSASRLVGSWRATLPVAQERGVLLTRFALATPPDEAGFEAMSPSEAEREHFGNILRLRDEEPGSPHLSDLRHKLEQLDALRITITKDSIITPSESGNEVTGYSVESDLGDELVVIEDGSGPTADRRWVITFEDPDHIVMRKGRAVMPMTRIGAEPALDPPATPRGPAASGAGASHTRAELGGELGACMTTYHACLQQMPPESQEAMRPSLELVDARARQAADSPEARASVTEACENAVRLMRAARICD